MTLIEAKKEVAKKYGYETWADVDFYQLNENANITEPPYYKERLHDEAAELYARAKWDECFDATIYKAQQRFTGMTETQLRLSCIPKPEFKP